MSSRQAEIIVNIRPNNLVNAEIDKIKDALKGINLPKSMTANTATLQKQYANLFNTLKSIKGSYPEQTFDKIEQSIQKNLARIKELNKAYQENGKLTDEQKKEYISLRKELDQLSASFATTRAETDKLQKSNKLALPNVNNLRKGLANLLTTIQSTSKNYKKGTFDSITTQVKALQTRLLSLDKTSVTYTQDVISIKDELAKLLTQFAETKAGAINFHGSLKDIVGGFLKFQLAAMVVMKPLQLIRDTWNSLNETLVKTEDAVISLQRVLNDSSLSNGDISNKLYNLAIQYGQTFDNVNDIAQNFARTGMAWNETIKATESALLALNVAELDATQASDGMIAIMQQFGYEASDLTSIIDMLNKTADNYAVTTDKLLTALQRTGSSAKNAGMDLKETIGIISALSEATGRSGENIGTAVNSLIQYSRKDTALDTFASLSDNTSSVVGEYRKGNGSILDVWKAVSAEIQNLTSEQADKLDRYFNTEDGSALKDALGADLGEIYEDLEGVYDTANTFRKNYFIALLGNMDTVEDAIQTASKASGYSQKENEKYLDSYTAKVNSLQAQWQKIANDEQGLLKVKKQLVDFGSIILTIMEYTGGLKTTLIGISAIISSIFAQQIVSGIEKMQLGFSNLVNAMKKTEGAALSLNAKLGLIGLAATAIQMVGGLISKLVADAEEAKKEAEQRLSEANAKTLETALENIAAYKELALNAVDYSSKLKDLRAVLDDVTSTEEEKTIAQNELLSIQNSLIESNNEYAKSIDLINGGLDEQVNLVKRISEEQLKQQAQQFITENQASIATANNLLNVSTALNTGTLLEGNGIDRFRFGDIMNKLISKAGVLDIASVSQYENFGYFQTFGEEFWNKLSSGDVLGSLFSPFSSWLNENSWVGETKTGISLQGTTKQKLETIKKIKDTLATDYESIGFSLEEANAISLALSEIEKSLDTDAYQNAQKLADTAKTYEDFLKGAITQAEFLKEIYGIEMVDSTKTWEEQSSKVLANYQELLDTINAMRNAEQNILDIEEKRKALEDARNNKNVRVYNAKTGAWELQADQNAIAKAEKAYEDALWKNIESEIKTGNLKVTEILDKVSALPSLANAVITWLKDEGYNVPTDGLVFGTSSTVASAHSTKVNSNSTNDNRTYMVNGVPISNDMANNYTLVQIFEMFPEIEN